MLASPPLPTNTNTPSSSTYNNNNNNNNQQQSQQIRPSTPPTPRSIPYLVAATSTCIHSPQTIDPSRLTLLCDPRHTNYAHELGRGTFGVVYAALLDSVSPVAVKAARGLNCSRNGNDRQISISCKQFDTEICRYTDLIHSPSVPTFHGIVTLHTNPPVLAFVTDRILGESLAKLDLKQLNTNGILTITKKLVLAVADLHRRGISHGDIKPANIMLSKKIENGIVDNDIRIYLIDFGLSKNFTKEEIVKEEVNGLWNEIVRGTPAYLSPEAWCGDEAMKEKQVAFGADVYGIGMILYEIECMRIPWSGCGYGKWQVFDAVCMQSQRPEWYGEERIEGMRAIVEQCWKQDSKQRPSCLQIGQQLEQIEQTYHNQLQMPPDSAVLTTRTPPTAQSTPQTDVQEPLSNFSQCTWETSQRESIVASDASPNLPASPYPPQPPSSFSFHPSRRVRRQNHTNMDHTASVSPYIVGQSATPSIQRQNQHQSPTPLPPTSLSQQQQQQHEIQPVVNDPSLDTPPPPPPPTVSAPIPLEHSISLPSPAIHSQSSQSNDTIQALPATYMPPQQPITSIDTDSTEEIPSSNNVMPTVPVVYAQNSQPLLSPTQSTNYAFQSQIQSNNINHLCDALAFNEKDENLYTQCLQAIISLVHSNGPNCEQFAKRGLLRSIVAVTAKHGVSNLLLCQLVCTLNLHLAQSRRTIIDKELRISGCPETLLNCIKWHPSSVPVALNACCALRAMCMSSRALRDIILALHGHEVASRTLEKSAFTFDDHIGIATASSNLLVSMAHYSPKSLLEKDILLRIVRSATKLSIRDIDEKAILLMSQAVRTQPDGRAKLWKVKGSIQAIESILTRAFRFKYPSVTLARGCRIVTELGQMTPLTETATTFLSSEIMSVTLACLGTLAAIQSQDDILLAVNGMECLRVMTKLGKDVCGSLQAHDAFLVTRHVIDQRPDNKQIAHQSSLFLVSMLTEIKANPSSANLEPVFQMLVQLQNRWNNQPQIVTLTSEGISILKDDGHMPSSSTSSLLQSNDMLTNTNSRSSSQGKLRKLLSRRSGR